jgi:hypothetical protein
MEFGSSRDLLVWLDELGTARAGSGALKRGEYLLSLATSERKIPQPPRLFADWLYELRDRGSIAFDDSDALRANSKMLRNDVHLIRNIAVTAAGRAALQTS